MTSNRRINRVNWHFALKRHTIDSIEWRAVSPHPSDTWHLSWTSESSKVDAKMIHALVEADDENGWLTAHIVSIALIERRLSICKWNGSFFSVYCYDFRNHANKCHETRKFHNLRTYVGAKSCPNLTFRLFYSIHKAYQEDSHSAKIRGKVTVVRPVKLAADTYCNYAIPTATMWPYDPCD